MLCSSQIRKRLIVSDKGQLEWKKMYFKLCRCYPHKEQYTDTLQFCTHCHILFWKVTRFISSFNHFIWKYINLFFSIYGNFMAITDFFFFVHFRIQTILALPITQRAAASLSLHRVSSTFSNSRGRCIAAMYIVSIVQRIPGWLEAGKRWGGIRSKCHNVLWRSLETECTREICEMRN